MPHFIIEQGNALTTAENRQKALEIAAHVGSECGFIKPADIKLRLRDYDDFLLLDGGGSFIHVTVRLLAGRSSVQKEALSVALRAALAEAFAEVHSISIEICDMDPVSYKKRLLEEAAG